MVRALRQVLDAVEHEGRRLLPDLRSRAAPGGRGGCGRGRAEAGEAASPLTAKDINLREMAGKDAKAPWHFKLLMVLLAIYLGWRLVQLIELVV